MVFGHKYQAAWFVIPSSLGIREVPYLSLDFLGHSENRIVSIVTNTFITFACLHKSND